MSVIRTVLRGRREAVFEWHCVVPPMKRLSAPLLALALGGWALHPVQQDVTHMTTNHVVRQIRCEARLAIIDKAVAMLEKEAQALNANPDPVFGLTHQQQVDRLYVIAQMLQAGRTETIKPISRFALPSRRSRAFYDRYIYTVIAYDFLFNVTEGGGVTALADP